jgi:predicted amidohydrolase
MRVALAQVPHPTSFVAGLEGVQKGIAAAAESGARLVCFPECCLKGVPGTDYTVEALTHEEHNRGLADVQAWAAKHGVCVVFPTERPNGNAWNNGAYVIQADGSVQGYQTKNQVPQEEEPFFAPGSARRLFRVNDLTVGIVICHEGWRYPETVRWAARRGAQLVLHPHLCGGPGKPSEKAPVWGSGYYERAMACRAGENHVWFASVNFAMPVQDCRTSVVSPEGECVEAGPLHREALVVAEVDPAAATGYLAKRFAPERYLEEERSGARA